VTAELNIHPEDPVCTKTGRCELHKPNIHGRAAIAEPLIPKSNAQMHNNGFTAIKHGHWTTENAWYGQMSHPSRCSLHQEEFTFGEHPRKPKIRNASLQQWNTGEVLWWYWQKYCGTVFCWSQYYPSWLNYYNGIHG
jgi:hypothetical protein